MSHTDITIPTIFPVARKEDLPLKIREYFEQKMEWYHGHGEHLALTVDILLERCPTYLVSLEGGIILIQKRGGVYNDFAIDVFNDSRVIVDARNYIYPDSETVPEKWPDGTPVVDCRKPMDFEPPDKDLLKFIPPQ